MSSKNAPSTTKFGYDAVAKNDEEDTLMAASSSATVQDGDDDDDDLVLEFGLQAHSINYSFVASPVSGKHKRRRRHNKHAARIPQSLRIATNAASLVSCFCFSGIIYGWAPLKLILLRENQFSEERERWTFSKPLASACPSFHACAACLCTVS